MAKATAAGGGGGRGRPPAVSPAPAGRAGYAIEVYQELRKTTWPTGRELRRMTEVVVATVIMFGLLIGGLDFLLTLVVKPLYTQVGGTQATGTPQQTFTPVPRASPTTSATTSSGTGSVSSSSSAGTAAASSSAPAAATGTGSSSSSATSAASATPTRTP